MKPSETVREDLVTILSSGAVSREAVATVFAQNLAGKSAKEICRKYLIDFLQDEQSEVRAAASRCFSHVSDEQFVGEGDLILATCTDGASKEVHHSLLRKFKTCKAELPVEILDVAEKIMDIMRSDDGNDSNAWWMTGLVEPIFHFYAQLDDGALKVRTLDIVDMMISCRIHGIEDQLGKLDR